MEIHKEQPFKKQSYKKQPSKEQYQKTKKNCFLCFNLKMSNL